MKSQYVKELAEGTRVESEFAVSSREIRATRHGDAYLSLELSDRTGRVPAVHFRPDAVASRTPVGSVVRVSGTVTSYRGLKRISVDRLRPARTFDPDDLLGSGPRDADEMLSELRELAGGVRDRALRSVLRAVFGDEEFLARFTTCPGSQSHHHAYRTGLLEHTVAVAAMCSSVAERYAGCDRDLLVCAALLHDIGKVFELEHSSTIEYSDQGRLLGHVVLGDRHVQAAIARSRLKVPTETQDRLSHAILSHHGELEWGSPKRPSSIEALLLHHIDNLDAKAAGFVEIARGAIAADERWTDAQNLFRRPLYAPVPFEDQRAAPVLEDEQYHPVSA